MSNKKKSKYSACMQYTPIPSRLTQNAFLRPNRVLYIDTSRIEAFIPVIGKVYENDEEKEVKLFHLFMQSGVEHYVDEENFYAFGLC